MPSLTISRYGAAAPVSLCMSLTAETQLALKSRSLTHIFSKSPGFLFTLNLVFTDLKVIKTTEKSKCEKWLLYLSDTRTLLSIAWD